MVPELLVTALLLGWLLRGKFDRLADVQIRYFWMIFVPVGLYLAALAANFSHVFKHSHWIFGVVHIIMLGIFLLVTIANRHIPGVKLMFAGLAVNLIAILANGGYMPTAADAIRSIWGEEPIRQMGTAVRHALIDSHTTRLSFLCDIIAARHPFVLVQSVYSIGDIITSVGGLIAIVAIMRNPKYSQRAVSFSRTS